MNWQRASTQSYYRIEDGRCDIQDHSVPLLVNCSGVSVMDAPFKTYSKPGRHDYYLMYLVHGQLDAQAGTSRHLLSEGDAIIYTPEQSYGYQRLGDERMVYLWVHFTGAEVDNLLRSRSLCTDTPYHLGRSEEMESTFEAFYHLFITRPLYYLEEAAARLVIMLTHIGRSVHQPEDDHLRDRLKTSLSYLNHHYAESISLETLAGMEYLSASRYSALFRQLTGVSPQKYLIDLRLKNAREMLLSTDLSIAEVARSVGYDDPLYFSRLFRKHMEISPREARQSAKQTLP